MQIFCNSTSIQILKRNLPQIPVLFDQKLCRFLCSFSKRTTLSLRRSESLSKPLNSFSRSFTLEFNSDSSESLSEASESILVYSSIFLSTNSSKWLKSPFKSFLWLSSHVNNSSTLLHVVSFPLQQTTRLNFHNLLSLLQLLVYPPLCANNEEHPALIILYSELLSQF